MAGSSNRFGFWLLVFAAGCATGLLAMALFGTSPREAQKQREAPTISPATAEVVRQVVADEERALCDIDAPIFEVVAPVDNGDQGPLVISKIELEEGQRVKGGDLLFELSGRPIVAFETPVPFYRDLSTGTTGEDVKYLETNLVNLGKLDVADSTFGPETAEALIEVLEPLGIEGSELKVENVQSTPPESVVAGVNQALGATIEPETVVAILRQANSVANCSLPPALTINVGDRVSLAIGGEEIEGAIQSVGDVDDSGFRSVVFEPTKSFGGDVDVSEIAELIVEIESSDEAVLSVPVGALFQNAQGDLEVRKTSGEAVQPVTVELGTVAGGFAEVKAADLAEGDTVQLHAGPPPVPVGP